MLQLKRSRGASGADLRRFLEVSPVQQGNRLVAVGTAVPHVVGADADDFAAALAPPELAIRLGSSHTGPRKEVFRPVPTGT